MYLLEQRLDQERKQGIEGQTIWGVTEFFDWTEDEIAKLLIPHNYNEQIRMRRLKKIIKVETKQGYVRPKQWDWREKGVVTHVKNQLNCGSCWAFSVVGMVETMHAIHNGTLVRLSEQQLIDCDSAENGCEGGFRPYALRYIRDKGLLSENAYPDPTQRVFIDEWRSLPSDEDQIADWIATNGPVTFGMNATKSMYHYKGGIFSPSPEECNYESLGSHSMEVIGYGVNDKDIPYWILKNSWGSGYGVNGGYLHMRRGVNSCGLTREVYSALIKK
uniref:Peptidase C1A papain C-terminal domain-containing protein n=2 Tax=Meloidogyne javanica TaxID=6303 RepID=A0A915LQM4_MELJA